MSIPNLGEAFTGDSHYSPPRTNAKGWLVGTGDEIAAIPNTFQVPASLCIETGSGFIKDVVYYSQYDNTTMVRTGWLPFSPKHNHDSDDDIGGGLFSNMWNANMGKFMFLLIHTPKAEDFTINKTGTNAAATDIVATDEERLTLTTGNPSVANDLITATKSGIKVNWGNAIYFQLINEITDATSVLSRAGIGVERMDIGTDDRTKIGIECCSVSTAFKQILTADGNTSSRTLLTTTAPIAAGSVKSDKLILDPGVNVKYYIDGVLNTTKSNNIPASGATNRDRLFRAGVKSTNTTEKVYRLYAVGIYYVPNDKWF